MTPFCAARPTCSGLVIVPKLARMPAARLAAIDTALAVASGESPSSFAVAAIAPKVPIVPEE